MTWRLLLKLFEIISNIMFSLFFFHASEGKLIYLFKHSLKTFPPTASIITLAPFPSVNSLTWHWVKLNLIIKQWNILYTKPDLTIGKYSRLPKTRTFKGNRKKFELSGVQVIGSSKKIAESKVKNSFYCTVNILITFNCRNVKWKLEDTFRL